MDNYQIEVSEVKEPSGWYDAPCGHSDKCECEKCHGDHQFYNEVERMAYVEKMQCCADQLSEWKINGKYCEEHKSRRDDDGLCFKCEKDLLCL